MLMVVAALIVVGGLAAVAVKFWRIGMWAPSLALGAWAPAMGFTLVPVTWLAPEYAALNHGVSLSAYVAVGLGFMGFCLGSVVAMLATQAQSSAVPTLSLGAGARDRVQTMLLWLIFLVGMAVFFYAFVSAGLLGLFEANPEEVFRQRLAFHIGSLNHLIHLLDIAAILFLAQFMRGGSRWSLVPPAIVLLSYLATLQKGRVMLVVCSAVFLFLCIGAPARRAVFGTLGRSLLAVFCLVLLFAGLMISNSLRGIGHGQYTDLPYAELEQIYIYAGAPALLNLSGTIEGIIPCDPPNGGRTLLRTFLWLTADRTTLNPTLNLEGINNGTALIFYWHDFRWLGVIFIPTLAGFIITWFFHWARRGGDFGLVAGCMAANAAMFSVYTDVLFEPTTAIILLFGGLTTVVLQRLCPSGRRVLRGEW